MSKNPSLAVLLPTYNRAEILRETLDNFCRIDRNGLSVTLYVINNNSSDDTEPVIMKYMDKLPIFYIFEPLPGKNGALNNALKKLKDEEIIVFTDDDVTPCTEWFHEIANSCERWPGHDVFGGKILVAWPQDVKIPAWADVPDIMRFGFVYNNEGDEEILYPKNHFPFGPNFWVKRKIIDEGKRFDVITGPRPKGKKMGGEIVFLKRLTLDGYEIVYSPKAVVHHRIEKKLLTASGMLKRTYARGKGMVYMSGMPDKKLLEANSVLWYLKRIFVCFKAFLRFCKALLNRSSAKRFERIVSAVTLYSLSVESISLAREQKKQAKK